MVMVGDAPLSQIEFAALVGVSQQAISALQSEGALPKNTSGAQLLHAYCARLREVAAGRQSAGVGSLDLVQERAALAFAQREGIEIKNAVMRGEYASVSLLSQVLATASQSIVDRLDSIPATLKKRCPDMSADARDAIMEIMAAMRADWIRSTEHLVVASIADDDDALYTNDDPIVDDAA
jgi:phage terminase Nu1 subunit (DNA packaging protein)